VVEDEYHNPVRPMSNDSNTLKPLAVAVGIITSGDEILLIQRKRNDYVGFWSLPGGKIGNDESSAKAILRELLEETGIAGTVTRYAGLVSEILKAEDDTKSKHFLLHVHEVQAHGKDIVQSDDEGTAAWFEISSLDTHKEKIIPSDYLMILNMSGKPESVFDCLVEKIGDDHTLKYFKKR
jgi:8-oxo-dGTP diphosphatase